MEETRQSVAPERELPMTLGPFSITGLLGEGGSAVVYAARFGDTDVALKLARDERELSPREAERFLEEARMLSRVRHECVVEVLDSGRLDDGRPYLVMRRYQGETLAARLAREGALELAHALELFSQLADATATLHEAGLLHRDIKPENVFLMDEGRRVKLLDFGIAKDRDAPASTTTQAGIARGTPATMAPERFFGAAATELTDVYELAVVLYAMLVGRLPWQDATNVNARLNPVSPIDSGANVPEALSTAIMRALSTRPERRPRNVRELAERVKLAAAGEETRAEGGRVTAATAISEGPPPASGPRDREPTGDLGATITTAYRSDGAQIIDSRRSFPPLARPKNLGLMLGGLLLAGALAIGIAASSADEEAPAAAPTTPLVQAAEPTPALDKAVLATPPARPASAETPESSAKTATTSPRARNEQAPRRASAPPPSASAPPPIKPGPSNGKPKGAPCTRSSECASMLCAAETCQ